MTNSTTPKTKRSTKATPAGSTMPAWRAFEKGYLAASSSKQDSHGEQRTRLA